VSFLGEMRPALPSWNGFGCCAVRRLTPCAQRARFRSGRCGETRRKVCPVLTGNTTFDGCRLYGSHLDAVFLELFLSDGSGHFRSPSGASDTSCEVRFSRKFAERPDRTRRVPFVVVGRAPRSTPALSSNGIENARCLRRMGGAAFRRKRPPACHHRVRPLDSNMWHGVLGRRERPQSLTWGVSAVVPQKTRNALDAFWRRLLQGDIEVRVSC